MWNRFISSILFVGLLGIATNTSAQQHKDIVAKHKTILLSRGESLSETCGAFKITREVAADPVIRAEGWGLVHSTGNGCALNGDIYRADTLMQPNGFTVDILTRSESDNGDISNNNAFNIPAWDQTGDQSPANWRAPLASAVAPVPVPVPGPQPTPTPVPVQPQPLDLSGVYERFRLQDDAAERRYLDLGAQNRQLAAQNAALAAQLAAHDEKVSGIVAFIKDGKTWTGLIGILGGYLANRYMNNSSTGAPSVPAK